ncbi:MAG: DUF523 domain-containing protein [Candidatus Coprovivens sp.]
MKEKILVSACLLGTNCKYSGGNNYSEEVIEFLKDYEIIPVCPEQLGGLPTPRPASEIIGDKVMNNEGTDVTSNYQKGAEETLKIAQLLGIKKALLKAKSPSCGNGKIYDGTFSGILTTGDGITTKLLKENNIEVITIK